MKKLSLILFSLVLNFNGFCQDASAILNCLITIDEKIVILNITSGSINVFDNNINSRIQVPFDYEVGRIKIKKEDFDLLINTSNSKAVLEFNYRQICPHVENYTYRLNMDLDYLFQRYLIIDIFNLDKKINRRTFGGKSGYVFDVEIPSKKISTPRRIIEKEDC